MTQPTDDDAEALALGKALSSLRRAKRIAQPAAGEAFEKPDGTVGISGQGWAKYENGSAPSIHRPDTQRRLAAAIGHTLEDLLAEKARLAGSGRAGPRLVDRSVAPPASDIVLLPVRDRVQAGAWLDADDTVQTLPIQYASARDPRFPHAKQWLSAVVGDSVDLLRIFDGDLAHCVDAIDIGYAPRTKDIVEVERLRFSGAERELTIKQVEVTPGGILLWPRSTNSKWQHPLELLDGVAANEEEVEVRIRALVVASVRRLSF